MPWSTYPPALRGGHRATRFKFGAFNFSLPLLYAPPPRPANRQFSALPAAPLPRDPAKPNRRRMPPAKSPQKVLYRVQQIVSWVQRRLSRPDPLHVVGFTKIWIGTSSGRPSWGASEAVLGSSWGGSYGFLEGFWAVLSLSSEVWALGRLFAAVPLHARRRRHSVGGDDRGG